MPNTTIKLDDTITINGRTGIVYALDPIDREVRKVLVKLPDGRTFWAKVPD